MNVSTANIRLGVWAVLMAIVGIVTAMDSWPDWGPFLLFCLSVAGVWVVPKRWLWLYLLVSAVYLGIQGVQLFAVRPPVYHRTSFAIGLVVASGLLTVGSVLAWINRHGRSGNRHV